MNELIEALKKGVVVISFKKIDTDEIRVMPSTLNEDLMPKGSKILNISLVFFITNSLPIKELLLFFSFISSSLLIFQKDILLFVLFQ